MTTGEYKKYETLNWREFKYKILRRKKCPHCSAKMGKIEKKEHVGVGDVHLSDGSASGTTYRYVDRYNVKEFYHCDKCDKEYTLKELVAKAYGDT